MMKPMFFLAKKIENRHFLYFKKIKKSQFFFCPSTNAVHVPKIQWPECSMLCENLLYTKDPIQSLPKKKLPFWSYKGATQNRPIPDKTGLVRYFCENRY